MTVPLFLLLPIVVLASIGLVTVCLLIFSLLKIDGRWI